MKKLFAICIWLGFLSPSLNAQISGLEIRLGGDLWKLSYSASSSQINCGLCPQLIDQVPTAQSALDNLQESVMSYQYRHSGLGRYAGEPGGDARQPGDH